MGLSWFQVWTICWQVSIFMTPIIVGAAVMWLKSQFVTKTDATAERNRVDAALAKTSGDITAATNRIDAKLETQKAERDNRYEAIKDKLADHEGRIKASEIDLSKPPSRHQLNNNVTALQGGVHSLGKSIDQLRGQMEQTHGDMRRQMETLNSYLHTVIEKHLQ